MEDKKKKFEEIKIEVIIFEDEDVIRTSGLSDEGIGGEPGFDGGERF